MKKTSIIFSVLFILSLSALGAQVPDNPALFPILNHFSANNFVAGELSQAEVNALVQAGLRAPSAGNRQPWLFTVVQNPALAAQIQPNMPAGNILIIVSGVLSGSGRDAVILDAGLAAQSQFFAAQALGLGARQYTNAALINRANNLKSQLGIPDNHTAIIVTRFGRLPAGVDVVSSASSRADPASKVVYR
ncbi:MAG: nitroreductase family protein [Treponema sp.]|nr:nitroreductase family protein [Treponema sp.]